MFKVEDLLLERDNICLKHDTKYGRGQSFEK